VRRFERDRNGETAEADGLGLVRAFLSLA
jgi:hypothetical protein